MMFEMSEFSEVVIVLRMSEILGADSSGIIDNGVGRWFCILQVRLCCFIRYNNFSTDLQVVFAIGYTANN